MVFGVVVELDMGEFLHQPQLLPCNIACAIQPDTGSKALVLGFAFKALNIFAELVEEGGLVKEKFFGLTDAGFLNASHLTPASSIQAGSRTAGGTHGADFKAGKFSGGEIQNPRHVAVFLAFDGFGVAIDVEHSTLQSVEPIIPLDGINVKRRQ